MEAPAKITPHSLADYLEIMSKAVFQTGISWKVVENKWEGIKSAFQGFDPIAITSMDMVQIDLLVDDKRIIRNRRKVEAIIENARKMIELDKKHNGFRKYLRSFESYDLLAVDIRKQFKFLGNVGIYYFLWVVNEPVPAYEEWSSKYMVKGK